MRRLGTLVATVLAAALLVSCAAADTYIRLPEAAALGNPVVLSPNLATSFWEYANFASIDGARFRSGSFLLVAAGTDSTTLDSLAFEAFLYVGIGSTATLLIDTDDTNNRLDGWFCTSYRDSATMCAGTNLTPNTGAAFTQSKYPYDVSSRVLCARARNQASGVDIPGASAVTASGIAGSQSRSWLITLNDAFGGRLVNFGSLKLGILWRQPRLVPTSLTIYFIPATL